MGRSIRPSALIARFPHIGLACLAGLLLAAAAGAQSPASAANPADACSQLKQPIAAAAIGLPTGGATVESTVLVAPVEVSVDLNGPFAPLPTEIAVKPAAPEHCRVVGAIAPVDPQAPAIRFQVNLPTQWNGRSLQFGGGGFNGVLITGLALPPSARPDRPSPLSRGYVTYGTDSGHQNAPGVPLQAFALNGEALTNFAYASYKKVRDVAVELMKRRYGKAPRHLYFMGSSEGGREGITIAQRFPADFDGIFSRVPVINWVALQFAGTRMGVAQMGLGWISPEKAKLVEEAVLAACDADDGVADGIVSNYEGCKRAFDVSKLRCPPAAAGGNRCLSDPEIKVVETLHAPFPFNFALANGVRHYPGWGVGGEGASGGGPVGGWVSWQTGTAPPTVPPGPTSSRAWLYGSGAIQYFIARDPTFDAREYDADKFAQRVREVSALMDSTHPDLSAFAARGGKLIVSEHMADYAQSPYAGIEYYRSVVERLGQPVADKFLRLYVTPGADHMGVGAPSAVDMLAVLSGWVEQGTAPGDLVQVAQELAPPFPVLAARPMCRYPSYPRYRGGDRNSAESFHCVTP
jgi:feruloyl esterase